MKSEMWIAHPWPFFLSGILPLWTQALWEGHLLRKSTHHERWVYRAALLDPDQVQLVPDLHYSKSVIICGLLADNPNS